jgi:hypothetical protein
MDGLLSFHGSDHWVSVRLRKEAGPDFTPRPNSRGVGCGATGWSHSQVTKVVLAWPNRLTGSEVR